MIQTLRETLNLIDGNIVTDRAAREGLDKGFEVIRQAAEEEGSPHYALRDHISEQIIKLDRMKSHIEGLKIAKLTFDLRQEIIFIGKDETKSKNIE